MPPWVQVALVLFGVCTVFCVACTAVQLFRGLPAQLSRTVSQTLAITSECQVVCERLEKRAKQHLEAADDTFERVERKRASVAAAASRVAGATAPAVPFEAMDRDGQKAAIRRRAAQLGIG